MLKLQLANEAVIDEIEFPVAVEPKIDGMRMVFFISSATRIEAYSRGGKKYPSMGFIGRQLKRSFGPGIYDGEMFSGSWGATISDVKGPKHSPKLRYYVFDKLPYSDIMPNLVPRFYIHRRFDFALRTSFLPCSSIKVIPFDVVYSKKQLQEKMSWARKHNFEGLMLKKLESFYEGLRNDNWLKLKFKKIMDAKIIDIVEGTAPGTVGKMGQMEVILLDGTTFFVGSGFTMKEREEFLKHKSKYIGRTVEIKAQDDKEKVAKARHPVFLRIRGNND